MPVALTSCPRPAVVLQALTMVMAPARTDADSNALAKLRRVGAITCNLLSLLAYGNMLSEDHCCLNGRLGRTHAGRVTVCVP